MKQGKRNLITIAVTLGIISMLLFSPASAFQIHLVADKAAYGQRDTIKFNVSIDLMRNERLSISNLTLLITNGTDPFKTCSFSADGTPLAGCENIAITPVNMLGFGYGYLYGYGYKGYGYGYQEGANGMDGELTYNLAWTIRSENLPQGNYTGTLLMQSSQRSYQSGPMAFSINYQDFTKPNVTFLSPEANKTWHGREVLFDLNITDDTGIRNAWINAEIWAQQGGINYTGPMNVTMPDGTYLVYAYATDLSGNTGFTNISFTVDGRDLTIPSVRIMSPENERTYTNITSIPIVIEANDTGGNLDSIRYYMGGRMYPYTGADSLNVTYGTYVLMAYANDTTGNVNSTSVRFYVSNPHCDDNDGDGYSGKTQACPTGNDCNDNNANINPYATESCNGVDDNCNAVVDDIPESAKPLCPVQQGVCQGSKATCGGSQGWACTATNYGPNYSPVEVCSDNFDNNCNGQVNDGCFACVEGQSRTCGVSNVGACRMGSQSCASGQWNTCTGAVYPVNEVCGNGIDDNCNGATDEGCQNTTAVCTNGQTRTCGETSIGACQLGTQTCSDGQWGSCEDEVSPRTEICGNGKDDDCDGSTDEGCQTTNTGSGNGVDSPYVRSITSSGSGAPLTCTSDWQCTEWSACANGLKTRTCADAAKCMVSSSGKPSEAQSCQKEVVDVIVLSNNDKPVTPPATGNEGTQFAQPQIRKSLSVETLFTVLLAGLALYYVTLLGIFFKKKF